MMIGTSPTPSLQIDITCCLTVVPYDPALLERVLRDTFEGAGIEHGELSVAVVGGDGIREVNRRFLGKDQTTDVIAFTYELDGSNGFIDGEIVVNADEASRRAAVFRHDAGAELLLYAVHGALHLLGWEDSTEDRRNAMNQHATDFLAGYGVEIRTISECSDS